jgi:hypothetical protein
LPSLSGIRPPAESVLAHVEGELYRVGLHGPSPVSLFPAGDILPAPGPLPAHRYLRAR